MRPDVRALGLQAAALLTLLPAALAAAPQDVPGPTVEQLKGAYLACDREATRRVLSSGEAAACSQVSELLLQRGFEGDLEKLLAWWRAQKRAAHGDLSPAE